MRTRSAVAAPGSAAPPSVGMAAATGPAAGAGNGTTGAGAVATAGAVAIGATGAGAGGRSAPDWPARRSSGRRRPLITVVITGAITPMRTRTLTPIPLTATVAMAGTAAATVIRITDTEPGTNRRSAA